jgi:ABC-2 type transport system ATP-binding protein
VLQDVNLKVRPGEILGIMGPNGAGKSTLLRILSGLLLPSTGAARVAGLDVVRDRPRSRARVGAALSDDRGLSGRLTGRQNLQFYGALFGLFGHVLNRRVDELAAQVGAERLVDRPVRTLSTGERARLILCRALLHRPQVVIVDELTRSLDPGAVKRVHAFIRRDVAGAGVAVLLASHDLQELKELASRVVLLSEGRLEAEGPYAHVLPRAEAVFARVEAPA